MLGRLHLSSRRTVMLMGALLLLLAAYFSMQLIPRAPSFPRVGPPGVHPIGGKNSISGLAVKHTDPGAWTVEFNYLFTGAAPNAQPVILLTPAANTVTDGTALFSTFLSAPLQGTHHVSAKLQYPGTAGRTARVTALMRRYQTMAGPP